nr:unnamed protein product [Digitaria exilis]
MHRDPGTGLTNRSDQVFGVYARISAWGHEHIGSDSYSAAVIQVSKDQGSEFKALRAGLHTFPALYNDTKVHMFAQWTRDRDWKTGCYDTDCPGFVPFKTIFDGLPQPGMVVDELSSYNQTDKSIILQIVKDERKGIGGDWWLYRVSGPARFPLGFWPATLFGSGVGTAQHATEAAWYGAVGFGARGIEPAMVNRHGPSVTGHARAAYFADISLMGRDAQPVDPSPRGLLPMLNAKGCYEIAMDAAGNNTFFYGGPKLCLGASDRESCAKVIESIPGIQAANTAGNISDLCLHFAANKTTEAKALADTVLAATKGKAPYCLEACAKNVSSMADVLVDLPAKQDDMNAYLTAKNFRAKFKHEDPPICEKDCRNKSSTADETLLANKFHDIWNVVKVANSQIELMFPWPDGEDDDSDLA